jgi:hypothetical protein
MLGAREEQWTGYVSRNRRFHDLSTERIETDDDFFHGFNLGFVYLASREELFLLVEVAVHETFIHMRNV